MNLILQWLPEWLYKTDSNLHANRPRQLLVRSMDKDFRLLLPLSAEQNRRISPTTVGSGGIKVIYQNNPVGLDCDKMITAKVQITR